MTEVFVLEANVTTLAQMNKIPVKAAELINNFDRKNAPALAKIFADRHLSAGGGDEVQTSYADHFVNGMGKHISKFLTKNPGKKDYITNLAKTNWRELMAVLLKFKRDNDEADLKSRHVITFPDGYFWVKLNPGECEKEGEEMQHCGIADGIMYSLRDSNGKSHVTIDMGDKNIISQLRGKQNTTPDKKYWPYVKKFVEHFKVKEIDDVPDDELPAYVWPGKEYSQELDYSPGQDREVAVYILNT